MNESKDELDEDGNMTAKNLIDSKDAIPIKRR
jgi:hypothetical protein